MSDHLPTFATHKSSQLFTGWLLFLAMILLTACTPAAVQGEQVPAAARPTALPSSTPSPTPQPTVTPQPSPTLSAAELCSPLAEITLQEMPDLLTNPFLKPTPGLDDGHHGADFAFYSRGERKEMAGLPVQSMLPGVIAAAITDRPPYGNMVIVETRLADLPPAWREVLNLPLEPTPPPNPRLQCPSLADQPPVDSSQRSIYLLYAHMQEAPALQPGEKVSCGQVIGAVGTTGASVNPHLHLEARLGPSGAKFPTMAHYDNGASADEMAGYCRWRISGEFQMFDPMLLFQLPPAN